VKTTKKSPNESFQQELPLVDRFLNEILFGLFGFRRRYSFFHVLLLLANPTAHLIGDSVEHLDRFVYDTIAAREN